MALIVQTKVCPVCGETFTTQHPAKVYCSVICRKKAAQLKNKEYQERLKLYHAMKRKRFVEEIHAMKHECPAKYCDWKTPGQNICVMPRCMKNALAEEDQDEGWTDRR